MKLLFLKKNLKNPYLWFSFIALVVVLIQNQLGLLFSYDSNWYIIFANRISENLDFTRQPVYAPLYSWALGFLNLIGLSTIVSILVYWWISYFLMLIGFYLILKNIGFTVISFFAVVSNLTTMNLYRFAWTELGYSVLLIFAVLSLYKLINSNNKHYKIIFLLSISLLPLQRYIGAFISVYLGLIYLFIYHKNIIRRCFELFLAIIPISLVILWNLSQSGHFSGERESSTTSLIINLNQTKSVLYHNFRPEWFIFLISFFVLIIMTIKKKKKESLFFLFIFFTPFIQVSSQIYSNSTYSIDSIQPRYFIVLTPLFVLLFLLSYKKIFKKKQTSFQFYFLLSFLILISCNLFTLNNRQRVAFNENDISYQKIKEYISTIPENTKIGLFVKNTVSRQAELILTSKIIPSDYCQNYRVIGDYITEDLQYIPSCNNLKGHIYIPIKYDYKVELDYLIIDKIGLIDDWKKYFFNYKIIDFGSFFGLIR